MNELIRATLTTNQAVFDYGFKAILKQGKQSKKRSIGIGKNGLACAYNGANDTHCIAGHLMSPKLRELADAMGNSNIDCVIDNPDFKDMSQHEQDFLSRYRMLLESMQAFHDQTSESPAWVLASHWKQSYSIDVDQVDIDAWLKMIDPPR